jgi:hypothetical protein
MPLIPEKRLDKTGKLVTRHVRSEAPAPKSAVGIPAPAAAPSAPQQKQNAGKFKLRPKQLQKRSYREDITQMFLSHELQGDDFTLRQLHHRFVANDVEVLSVLAVAHDGDAMKMLNDGVRSTEEALDYLKQRGMEPDHDRTELVQEALRRNISAADYRDFFRSANLPGSKLNSPFLADAMELYSSASLRDQYHWVSHDVLDGTIRFEDIKHLGYTKLKPYDRLKHTAEALRKVNEPDAKYTIGDVKHLLDSYHGTGTGFHYFIAMEFLMHEGPEYLASANKHALYSAYKKYSYLHGTERIETVKYHLTLQGDDHYWVNDEVLRTLKTAGVDPVRAGELLRSGMDPRTIINVINEELPASIGEGWL